MKWEYCQTGPGYPDHLQDILQSLGKEGWEAYAISDFNFGFRAFLKRPIRKPTKRKKTIHYK